MQNDDWTVVTEDGSLSAHYENTVLITDGEPEILTFTKQEVRFNEKTWNRNDGCITCRS